MRKSIALSLLLFALINVLTAQNDSLIVLRERALLREGPGCFFKILADIDQYKKLHRISEIENWMEVEADSLRGYVSEKAFKTRSGNPDSIFVNMGYSKASTKITRHGMSAGIKGFAESYSKKIVGNTNFLDYYEAYQPDIKKFKAFRNETYNSKNRKYYRRRVDLPQPKDKDFYGYEEEGLGLSFAAAIVSEIPIYENPTLHDYVNNVGFILVEASNSQDLQFRFFILDTNDANAYACPGGTIFITRGMLRNIQTEAELATIIAHEIGHVALRHGLIELDERTMWTKADNAFDELDEETEDLGAVWDEQYRKIEEELDDIAFKSYERVVQGRLDKYEKEADFYALSLAARAGYRSWQIQNILSRLNTINSQSGNEHYTQDQLEIRIKDLWETIEIFQFPDHLSDKKQRWLHFKNLL